MTIRLSVVIPAHNEEDYLDHTLRCLNEQTRCPDEIIVVCDDCCDQTADVARHRGALALPVPHRNVSLARNAGIAAATGNVVLLQDADTIASSNLLEEICRAVSNGYVFGSARLQAESAHPLSRLRVWAMNHVSRNLGLFYGSGLFALRWALEEVGGYDRRIRWGEDVEITVRLKSLGPWRMIETATLSYCERKFRENGYFLEVARRSFNGISYLLRNRGLRARPETPAAA